MRARCDPIPSVPGGVFTRAQVVRGGVSGAALERAERTGRVVRLRRGIYASVDEYARHPARCQVLAAGIALGKQRPIALASSAAVLAGLETLRPWSPPARFALNDAWRWRALDGVVLHRVRLRPDQLTASYGVCHVVPALAVVHAALRLPFRDAVVLADSALRRGCATVAQLEDALQWCWNWPGAVRAARVVRFADQRAESVHESVCRVLFAELGLPPPASQVTLGDGEGGVGRVDFYWREHRTIAEADGKVKYADADALWREKRREDRLRDAGFEVVRIVASETTGRAAYDVGVRLRAAYARAQRLDPRQS